MFKTQVESDRDRFVRKCLEHRKMACERLRLMEYNARYDRDPDLLAAIKDCRDFISLIDLDLASAGVVLH